MTDTAAQTAAATVTLTVTLEEKETLIRALVLLGAEQSDEEARDLLTVLMFGRAEEAEERADAAKVSARKGR